MTEDKQNNDTIDAVMSTSARVLALLSGLHRIDFVTAKHIQRALLVDALVPLTNLERQRLGNIFRASIFLRQELDLFWLLAERNITTRSTREQICSKLQLPNNAIYIGSYRAPVSQSYFLEDLDYLLLQIRSDCQSIKDVSEHIPTKP
jgi:hypothetical protein